jgi:hypothetical protein
MLNLDQTLRDLRRQLERVNRAITTMESIRLEPAPKRRRGRRSMGHEERIVVSERIKRYWAERRAKEERKASRRPQLPTQLRRSS